jgi:ADP-ribose pyrophosphatase YjhB (NUDIX family)
MYLSPEIVHDLERRYGHPEELSAAAEFSPREFGLLQHCLRKERAHDVTLFIRGGDGRYALIRKPGYPEEVFRPPSGGIEPGEVFDAGAVREAWEETGLHVRLERYLLRVEARFSCGGEALPWVTHVFSAVALGGTLDPQDRHEIAEARWATAAEIAGRYRTAMLAWGSAGMQYRVMLQDAGLRALGHRSG